MASSFLERVEEQPEEKPSETEATEEQPSETVGAEAEKDSEGNVLAQSEQSEETETMEEEAAVGGCRDSGK